MARLVVWTKDVPVLDDKAFANRKYQPGMVVDILEDGQHAGLDVEGDKALGWWRMIEAPGTLSDYANLLGSDPEFHDPLEYDAKPTFPRKRVNRLDIEAIEAAKPAGKGEPISLSANEVQSARQAVAAAQNPDVIGDDADVIGG